jgi:hypothetical protein
MGLPSRQSLHARRRHGPDRGDDHREAPADEPGRTARAAAGLSALWLALAGPAAAESLRIATYNADLSRDGPGLLARDLAEGEAQAAAAAAVIAAAGADILLLTDVDWDAGLIALTRLQEALAAAGAPYPHVYAPRPNSGLRTGLDLDGDGRLNGPRDAQGYGRFPGQGGMALLSRLPLDLAAARDFSAFLWRDLPGNLSGGAGLPPGALAVQRLSTTGHWDVPVTLPGGGRLHLLAFYATPPVFDGAEDRNGRRNHDETAFWLRYLDGALPWAPPEAPFVLLGDANLDPVDGDGRPGALAALLADPRLTDPAPQSPGAAAAGGATDTTDWTANRTARRNLRVDYVLPSSALTVTGAGVFWPLAEDPLAPAVAAASAHRLVWVDVEVP